MGQIFVYLYHGTKLNEKEVMERAYNISNRTGELAKSTAMMLMQRGREEGIKQSLNLTIQKMLNRDFKANQIAEILEVPLDLVQKIEAILKDEDKKE